MQIDLFNQALLLGVAFLAFLGLTYGFLKNDFIHKRYKRQHVRKHKSYAPYHAAYLLLASGLFGLIMRTIVQLYFPQDNIPWESIVWAMPLGMAIILLGYNIRFLWVALASVGTVISSLALMLLLANNYYHYYPTLDSVFGNNHAVIHLTTLTTRSDHGSHTVFEQYYKPLKNQPAQGQILNLDIPASGSFSPRQGRIYLPPALYGNDMIKLPVIVLLAGYPGQPTEWETGGNILQVMNAFASKHKGLAPIVAMVDNNGKNDVDTECVNSKLGAAETYLVKDVPKYLKTHYQVSESPLDWTIAGYSEGGACSSLLALRNPKVYNNFINISGDAYPSLKSSAETLSTLFNGSRSAQNQHTPNILLRKGNTNYKTMNGWYFIGNQDDPGMVNRIADQAAIAMKAGINVEHAVVSGHHGFFVWKQGYVDALPWMMNELRLTVK